MLEQWVEVNLYNSDIKVVRRKIADIFTKLIDDFKHHSEKIIELEKEVNYLYDNLFSDFRTDLPKLKDADYRLYLFSILKLSNHIIILFLEEKNIEGVYNRKRRLTDKET
ncbi:MAG: hypothetical protein HDR88_16930 [Bacteroides sp.]|nr:hypothetical protein [Bacteroides sp.]MBD5358644.1 hypothetical protein [Bacteroides sp.]